jgi:hypothetical protein
LIFGTPTGSRLVDRADKAIKGMVGKRLTYRAADRLPPPF